MFRDFFLLINGLLEIVIDKLQGWFLVNISFEYNLFLNFLAHLG